VCGVDPSTNKADNKAYICESSKYVKLYECPSLQTCLTVGDEMQCGNGEENDKAAFYAKEGAPCIKEGSATCTLDKTIMLECVSGVWIAGRHCPPSECTYVNGDQPGMGCANGGYSVGDRCVAAFSGSVVCSTDLTKILGCSEGKAVVVKDCGSTQKCAKTQNGLACL